MKFLISFLLLNSLLFAQSINLRDTSNQYDYIIITRPWLVNDCSTFKQHKETFSHFKVLVVTLEDILTQFNDSSFTPHDVREFISYAGKYWTSPKPKYILLAASGDMIPNWFVSDSMSIIRELYGSDFYFSQSLYEPDSVKIDFYVGRVPARTSASLTNYFNKVISYEISPPDSWQNNSLVLSRGGIFTSYADYYSTLMPSYIQKKSYVDIIGDPRFGDKDSVINTLNNGVTSFWASGPVYDSILFTEDYIKWSDWDLLTNKTKPFVAIMTGTQKYGLYDEGCIMDHLILSENGAIGGIALTGPSFLGETWFVFNEIAGKLYSDSNSLGEIYSSYIPFDSGLSYYQKTGLNLWGDPSLKVKYNKPTAITVDKQVLKDYQLFQNYPNPFNPSTTIKFSLPKAARVKLSIYNSLGQEIASLISKDMNPGTYTTGWNASAFASGVYYYRIAAGDFVQTKKLILLK